MSAVANETRQTKASSYPGVASCREISGVGTPARAAAAISSCPWWTCRRATWASASKVLTEPVKKVAALTLGGTLSRLQLATSVGDERMEGTPAPATDETHSGRGYVGSLECAGWGSSANHSGVNPDTAAMILLALITSRDGSTTRALALAADMDQSAADDVLAALVVVGTAESTSPGRWRLHPLLREPGARLTVDGLGVLLRGAIPQPPPVPERVVFLDPPPPPRLRQLTAAARGLGVHPDALDVWAKEGLVPFTWAVGGRRRFDVEAIRALLEHRAA